MLGHNSPKRNLNIEIAPDKKIMAVSHNSPKRNLNEAYKSYNSVRGMVIIHQRGI